MNFVYYTLAAIVPLIIGFIWYNPKVMGNAWMQSTGLDEEKLKGANMGLIFGLTFVFSFMMAFFLQAIVIHQFGVFSTLVDEPGFNDPNSEMGKYFASFMTNYGDNFRTFKHGALHGVITALFFVMPVIGIIALFERKGFKYIAIHTGYWAISLLLMGGILCQFLKFPM